MNGKAESVTTRMNFRSLGEAKRHDEEVFIGERSRMKSPLSARRNSSKGDVQIF